METQENWLAQEVSRVESKTQRLKVIRKEVDRVS